jgi:hypothetical protein
MNRSVDTVELCQQLSSLLPFTVPTVNNQISSNAVQFNVSSSVKNKLVSQIVSQSPPQKVKKGYKDTVPPLHRLVVVVVVAVVGIG